MGNQHMTPGKASLSPIPHDIAPVQPQTVGKTTLVAQQHPTGEAGIDASGQGGPTGANNFLNQEQRGDLKGQIRYRLGVALGNIGLALETLRVEQMIKKPEELGFFMMLILGAVESVFTSYAGIALKLLRKHGAAKLAIDELAGGAAAVVDGAASVASKEVAQAAKNAERSLATLAEVQMNTVIKSGIAKGKTSAASDLAGGGAKHPAAPPSGMDGASSSDSAANTEKSQASGYLLQMKAEADVTFDQLSRDLGKVDDAQKLAWWKALTPEMHSQATYEQKFRLKLAQYLASPVSKIGRSMDWQSDGRGGGRPVEKEVRIVRVLVPGSAPRYAQQDSTFDSYLHDHPEKATRSPAYDATQGALSLAQDATWNIDGKEQRRHETPITADQVNLTWVPSDLEEIAQKKQEHVWQRPMETYQLSFAGGRPNLVKVAGS